MTFGLLKVISITPYADFACLLIIIFAFSSVWRRASCQGAVGEVHPRVGWTSPTAPTAHRCNYNILYSIFVNLFDHLQEEQCSQPQCIPISPISRHGKPFQNVKLSKTWKTKTATIWMPDYLPSSSTACYQVCTLFGPTALPQKVGTLYPDISPPTDNSLDLPLTTDLFQA